ncbi:MAG: putative metal-binding motif-containing protein [Myxococcales bacterium]|nr:putative metal-binding motif-containing protein [Myxococcales bacterium]
MRLPLAAAFLGAIAACQCRGPTEGAVRVVVRFASLRPGCLEVSASEAFGASEQVRLVRSQFQEKEHATVAVYRKSGWSPSLDLVVRSFEASCDEKPIEVIRSDGPISIEPGKVTDWEVQLAAVDADTDGWAAADGGVPGTDCDDQRSEVSPGAAESCGPTDQDCDGLAGCADPGCAAAACDDLDPCTDGDSCQADAGCQGAPRECNSPPGECFSSPGACGSDGGCQYQAAPNQPCDGGAGRCGVDGLCVAGETSCFDNVDDDNDGDLDCADLEDCLGRLCKVPGSCIFDGRCVADGGCATVLPVCAPPGQCFVGFCDAGACDDRVRLAALCDDLNPCTAGEACRPDGGCGGGAFCANPPRPQCYLTSCQPQGCQYTVDAGASCDDGDAGTYGDVCMQNGKCEGNQYSCPPADQCRTAGVPQGDGGCTQSVRVGLPCDGGYCQPDATCRSYGAFPYKPSNFFPPIYAPSAGLSLSNCSVTFNSGNPDAGFSNACAPTPAAYLLNQPDGGQAVLLAVQSLTVSSNSSINFAGPRPVILAVYGNAQIDGELRANSVRGGRRGAGSNRADCAPQSGAPGSYLSGVGGGGGGGAGFGTRGADGGENTGRGNGGPGGQQDSPLQEPLRGGCPGGNGAGGMVAQGGMGGGALQLSAAGSLQCNSEITASGAGGAAADKGTGTAQPGGGGGGSGGMLLLEANRLDITSNCFLTANGGAGGGGANNNAATGGDDGSTNSGNAAAGGNGEAGGGKGGNGGTANAAPTDGASTQDRGGGGGGAAVGLIYLRHNSAQTACTYAPAVASPTPIRSGCP